MLQKNFKRLQKTIISFSFPLQATLREESNAEKSPAEQKNAEFKNANLVQI